MNPKNNLEIAKKLLDMAKEIYRSQKRKQPAMIKIFTFN